MRNRRAGAGAHLLATCSAAALLLGLPLAAQAASGVIITTPQAGYAVPAGTAYLQINGTTITGNVTVPPGVVLAPGTGINPNTQSSSGSALRIVNSTLNGAVVNSGTISASTPLATYDQNGIHVTAGSSFSSSGGAAIGVTNVGLIAAAQSAANPFTYNFARGVFLQTATNFGTIINAGTIQAGAASVAIGNYAVAEAFGVAIRSSVSGAIVNSGTIGGSASALGGNEAQASSFGVNINGGVSASITNTGLIQQSASAVVTNTGTAVVPFSNAQGVSLTANGGTSTKTLTTAPGYTVTMSVRNVGTIAASATASGPAAIAEAFGIRVSAAGGTARAPNTHAYGATLTGTFTNIGLISVTSVMGGAVAGQPGEALTSAFQIAANGGQANLNAAGHVTPTNARASGAVLIGNIVNFGTLMALSVASGDSSHALVDSGFAFGADGSHTNEPGSTVSGGTAMGGITNAGLISATVITNGTNSNGRSFAQTEALHVDVETGAAVAANSRASGALFVGDVLNSGTITATSIGLVPQGTGFLVIARGGLASGTNAQATGGTFMGNISNGGTVVVIGTGSGAAPGPQKPFLDAMAVIPARATAKGAGATATGGAIIGNLVNSGLLSASLAAGTGTAAGIIVGGTTNANGSSGVFRGSITNTGLVSATATGGATAAGIRVLTPVSGGITNAGTIFGGTNALDFGKEAGGSTAFLQTGGLLLGGIAGNGGDTVTIAGGALQLGPTGKVSGLASFTLGAGGTLAFNVMPTQAPSITAGSVSLAGGLQVSGIAASEVFPNVIVGASSLTGAFSSVSSLSPGVHAGVVPDPTTPNALDLITLNLQQAGNFAELLRLGLEQPQALWSALQSRMVPGSGPTGLNGTLSASLAGAGTTVLADGAAAGDGVAGAGLWARGYGAFGSAPATANGSAFAANRAGAIIGGDWQVAPDIVLGGAFDYSHTAVNFGGGAGNASVDGYEAAGYAGWRDGPWYANGVASVGWNNETGARSIVGAPSATGGTSGMTYAAFGEIGYSLAEDDLRFVPYGALGYAHARLDAFTESGGAGSGLLVQAGGAASLQSALGVRVSLISLDLGTMGTITPELRAAWQHEFLDSHQSIALAFAAAPSLGAFTVTGSDFGRDSAVVGLGLSDQVTASARLYLNYDGRFTEGSYNDHAISGGVRVRF